MGKEIENTKIEQQLNDTWFEDADSDFPDELDDNQQLKSLPKNILKKNIKLKVINWSGGEDVKFKASLSDALEDVFSKAAEALGKPLLPPAPNPPLDILRCK